MASPNRDFPAEAAVGAEVLVNSTVALPGPSSGDDNMASGPVPRIDADVPGTKPSSLPGSGEDRNNANEACGGNPEPVDDQSQILSRIKRLQDELVQVESSARQGQNLESIERRWDIEFDRIGSDAEQRNWTSFQRMRAQRYFKDTTAFAVGREWVHESEDSFIWNMLEREEHDRRLTERRTQWETRKGITQPKVDDSLRPAWLQPNAQGSAPFPTFLDPLSPESRFNNTPEAQGYDTQERQLRSRMHDVVRAKHDAFTRWKRRPMPPPPGAPQGNAIDVWPSPVVSYLQWKSFRYCSPPTLFMSEQKKNLFAIDVLDGEPDHNLSRETYDPWNQTTRNNGSTTSVDIPKMAQGLVPERIRLNGPQFPQTFGALGAGRFSDAQTQMVVLQPYRLLVYYDQDIRKRHAELQERLAVSSDQKNIPLTSTSKAPGLHEAAQSDTEEAHHESIDASSGSSQGVETSAESDNQAHDATQHDGVEEPRRQPEDKPGKDSEDTKFPLASTKTALAYLGCLIDFMDTTVSVRRNYVRGPECRKIHFRDLWYLFNPGDDVVRRDEKQVYRVIEVTNPTHNASSKSYLFDLDDEDHSRYFQISCVFVDFDGKRIGPVSTKFVVKAFAGERSVESLEVYPLRLHRYTAHHERKGHSALASSGPRTLRQELIKRGKKFFQAACMKLENTFYDGPTADGDEVESQVVVDFETALSSGNNFDPTLVPQIESLLSDADDSSSILSDYEAVTCRAACCDSEFICDDSFVEERHKGEYIESLIPKNTYAKLPSVAIYPRTLDDTTGDNALTDDDFLLMSYRVFAFVLRTRKWGESYSFSPR